MHANKMMIRPVIHSTMDYPTQYVGLSLSIQMYLPNEYVYEDITFRTV